MVETIQEREHRGFWQWFLNKPVSVKRSIHAEIVDCKPQCRICKRDDMIVPYDGKHCPVCGNVIHSMGEAVVHCHGIQLLPAEAEQTDEHHMIFIERVEDEYFVRINHEMTKTHYISFIAAVSSDRCQMVKLYPEGEAEARFKICGVRRICFYCNRDGLFSQDVVKGIDDKESGYDDTQERRELEQAADMLFG